MIITVEKLKEIVKDQTLEIDLISDSGHTWLKIPKALSFDLDYSKCSYHDENNLYLEEDRDASLFLDELKKHGIKYGYNEINYNGYCYIRNLKRFNL